MSKRLSRASPMYYVVTNMRLGWVLNRNYDYVWKFTLWAKAYNTRHPSRSISGRTVGCLLRDGWIALTGHNSYELTDKGRSAL